MAVHLPQADDSMRNIFFDTVAAQAESAGLTSTTRVIESMPDFWGPLLSVHNEGITLDAVRKLRDGAWKAYERSTAPRRKTIPILITSPCSTR